jgi:16S rRNA (guanine(966)-N(2))-methyltransferase RsmD
MASPRIIAGSAKGIRLRSVPGKITRPITDRVKEALFNIIGQDVTGATFLDVFAGTGSVGLEAMSRGASFARFTEIHPSAIKVLKENIKLCRFEENTDVIKTDAFLYLSSPPERAFDYIFIAPPQYQEVWLRALRAIEDHLDHCSHDSWIIVQIDPIEYTNPELRKLIEIDRRRYGSTLLLFFSLLRE